MAVSDPAGAEMCGGGEDAMETDDDVLEVTPVKSNNNGSTKKKEVDVIFESKSVIKQVKGASLCWKFLFFKGTKEKGANTTRVFCKLCPPGSSGIAYNKSTSSLTDHMKRYHQKEFQKAEIENAEANNNTKAENKISNYLGSQAVKVYKWPKTSPKWKAATQQLAKWLCKNSRPSSIVEDEGFIKLMALLSPEYEVPCDQTMTNYIWRMYEEEKKKLKDRLVDVEYCALTSDGGTSSNAVSFQDTNVHYIDKDLYLQTHTLAVKENKEKHTAENYRANTDKLTDEFEISEKIVMNVTDNEAKMKLAFNKEERSGCVSHLLHSGVSKAMDKVDTVKSITAKIRKITKRHNKSYAFRYGLQVKQKRLGIKVKPLSQDVPNRWGSTRSSTASFLDAKEKKESETPKASNIFGEDLDTFQNADAINEALRDIKFKNKEKMKELLLSRGDMIKIKKLNEFLTKLDVYSTTLGGSQFVTSSIVLPVVKSLKKHLEVDDEDPRYIADMKEIILDDLKERTADNLNLSFLIKATALDPRFKNLKVIDVKEEREKAFDELEKEMKENALQKSNKSEEKEGEEDGTEKVKKRKLGLDFNKSDDDDEDNFDEIKKEVDSYRHEAIQPRDEDPLDWWRKRKARYPHLVKIMRKYLCVPATSTQAERVFSALGLLLTKRRLCMTGANVNAQLFFKDNL